MSEGPRRPSAARDAPAPTPPGAVHPGVRTARSRRNNARRCARVNNRTTRPRSRSSPAVPSTCGTSAASHANRRTTAGAASPRSRSSPAPPRPRSLLQVAQRDRHVQRRPRPRGPIGALLVRVHRSERRHTSASASTRRCPAGRRSRSPVSPFGAGADNGPIAASNTAACSGVIHNWYCVTSPDSTTAGQPRPAPTSLQVVQLARHPVLGQQRAGATCASGPHPTAHPTPASPHHRRHRLRHQERLQPAQLPNARQRQPRRHLPGLHPRPQHPQRRLRVRPRRALLPTPHAPLPARPDRQPATSPAPPCRNDGANSRTHPCTFTPTPPPHHDAPPPPSPPPAPHPPPPPPRPPPPAPPPARHPTPHPTPLEPDQRVSGSLQRGAPLRQTTSPDAHTPS